MTSSKFRMAYSLALVCIPALLWLVSILPAAQTMPAAPPQTNILDATQDTYTDINLATTNLDEGLLNAANSPGRPEEPDVTTKQVFVEFDLSAVDFEIKSATLRLSTLTCGGLVPVNAVDVIIYGVNNDVGWAEDSLTWDNQPELSTGALASLDAGETTFDTAQTYTWTDSEQGDFTAWLETQRGANEGSATLVLVIENADEPGMADVFFEDHQGTGAVYGCADSLGGPTLEVSNFIESDRIFLPLLLNRSSTE